MIRLSFLAIFLVLLVPVQLPSATEWRGLSPVKSTRMDVERTLGPPDQNIDNQQLTYYFPDVVLVFGFAGNPKCQQKLPHTSWDVTSDSVTAIDVSLRHPPLLSETGIDQTKFKKIQADYDLVGRYYYLSPDDDGFAIEVGNKYVMGYHYAPGSKHKNLRCDPNKSR